MTSAQIIMIVDDQPATRMLIRSSLRALGYNNVVECSDGEAALGVLAERPAQLIISDLNMPKLDGLGLLRAVRANPELKGIPFIMLTGRGEAAVVKEAAQIGINGYLVKPFAMGPLKQKVEATIGKPN